MKIAGAAAALLMIGLGTGCQTGSDTTVEPAYIVGVTPLGMRLDPIIWGTITRFDIASVDGAPPRSKSRTSVAPGQHTLVIDATNGWSGRSNSTSITFDLRSGHTYLLRPSSFGGLTYLVVIDNDAGLVVARSETQASGPITPAVAAMPAPLPPAEMGPPKPDFLQSNADGTVKTRGVYENDAKGRVATYTVYDGAGILQYKEFSYYGGDGRLIRADRRDADGKLQRVTVYFDTFAKVLNAAGEVIETQDLAKSPK